MRSLLRSIVLPACTVALFAQAQAPAPALPARTTTGQSAPAGKPEGMAPEWDIRAILQEMSAHAARLLPLLDKIDVKVWTAKGASETYATQLQSCKDQARAVVTGAKDLLRQPDKLSAALELYFRMQGIDNMLASLLEGIRKYQNPAVAEVLAGVAAENGANRDRFQRYIVDLVAEREQQFTVMDHEAQRCRGILARQPVEAPKNSGRTK
jgi:hypothetical protein